MNKLTYTRIAANLVLSFGGVVLCIYYFAYGSIGVNVIWWLGGAAILGGLLQFVISIFYPRDIRPTWDEVAVASHRGSYQFGYWCALAGFWIFLIGCQYWNLNFDTAMLLLGTVLICSPSIWMVIATLRGRA